MRSIQVSVVLTFKSVDEILYHSIFIQMKPSQGYFCSIDIFSIFYKMKFLILYEFLSFSLGLLEVQLLPDMHFFASCEA